MMFKSKRKEVTKPKIKKKRRVTTISEDTYDEKIENNTEEILTFSLNSINLEVTSYNGEVKTIVIINDEKACSRKITLNLKNLRIMVELLRKAKLIN